MTVRWERFAGSTDSFAVRLAFMPDPDAGVAADPAESASWGAIQVWVEGQNLATHVDQGEVLHSAHWYLLPLLEWFADNWNPLLHEEKLPNRNIGYTAAAALEATRNPPPLAGEAETVAWEEERYEWRSRHCIRTARAGGLLPNVVIRRLRDLIEISWNDEPLAGTPRGFRYSASNGAALLYPEQVAGPLYQILADATDYLREISPDQGRLESLGRRLALLTAPAQHERRIEWLAGLRQAAPLTRRLQGYMPEEEMHVRWSEIVTALTGSGNDEAAEAALAVEESPLAITGSCHAALMFGSMAPTVTENDVRTIASLLVSQYSRESTLDQLASLGRPVVLDSLAPPWDQGYDLAEEIHAELALDLADDWVDVTGILQDLGVSILSRKLEDEKIRACCIVGKHHIPTIIHNESSPFDSPHARRFSLAHELCHLLFDQSSARKVAIASGPWAPKGLEQRANAFAAMFLMPPELITRVIADVADPVLDVAGISRIANRLRVSRRSLIDHLYNLTLMGESERDDLLRLVQD